VRLAEIARSLLEHCACVLIVDDGNDAAARDTISALHAPADHIEVIRREANGGKGAAMMTGFQEAIRRGFTHALQIDADGQHDVQDLAKFVAAATAHPTAVICGQALFDESAPSARKIGRYITHVWVWIETCSLDIADSMCGYRIYPLAAVNALMGREAIGARMDFDTEILVHLHWRGAPVVNVPTRVIYPEGNNSNFRIVRDNVRISLMHTRLAVQAPFRLALKALRGFGAKG
jgi:glycosyltransferase involved in cell wall biosynthesis